MLPQVPQPPIQKTQSAEPVPVKEEEKEDLVIRKKQIKDCVRKVKQEYLKHELYLYKCYKCKDWMNLSQKTCLQCMAPNYYYDNTIILDSHVAADAKLLLANINKDPNVRLSILGKKKEEKKVETTTNEEVKEGPPV